jgi:hypothetical protein
MALKVVLIGPRGTVFKDGKVQAALLREFVLFIQRMQAKGVHVGLWSQHYPVSYRHQGGEELIESSPLPVPAPMRPMASYYDGPNRAAKVVSLSPISCSPITDHEAQPQNYLVGRRIV